PVGGGYRDNAPYIKAYADTIRAWNARWEYPRLICSTNAKFYDDVSKVIPATLPVWRGELPGQDYPNGATSTAVATAANRRTHAALPDAEQLAIAASLHTGYRYPAERIGEAYAESLLHDEHTWGYHFPAGPATRAAECEKALRAFRAEAFAAEVRDKAMAHIADAVKLESGALFLVVFNPTSWALTAPLSVPMREMDGTGSEMRPKDGALVGALLGTRWHAYPDMAYLQEGFDIIDVATGESVAYDVAEVKDAFDPVDFAPQRVGLGNGTRRYGFFESPGIVRHDIRFVAKDVPAHGYRAYRLKKGTPPVMARHDRGSPNIIENKHYRIVADGTTMRLVSVYDKEAGRELADPDGGDFYRLIVRGKTPATEHGETRLAVTTRRCNTYSEMRIDGSAHGHPVVRHHIRLHDGIKRIAFETSLFKDPTPLLNVHLAFPMKAENPRFRYEGALCVMEPVKDYLPNAYSDLITVQSWVRIQDGDYHILWHSHDAPMAGFGTVWPGYTSPAHRCAIDESFRHAPQTEKEYHRNGWIFSQLCDNNFGTNFAVSQSGVMVFRYCLTTGKGVVGDADAAKWGWQAASSGTTLFTDKASPGGTLPPCGQFLACDNPATPVLHWKAAEDGRGVIVRLWNMSDRPQTVTLAFTGFTVTAATFTNMVEVDASGEGIILDRGRCAFPITPNAIVTVRALIGA
ncbi:MAG: hypothetical protein FWF84_05355, partial [Kiritimatiellaeota bacterium]|nr:hypothetical protein [Kiritimatiellota bacterium]